MTDRASNRRTFAFSDIVDPGVLNTTVLHVRGRLIFFRLFDERSRRQILTGTVQLTLDVSMRVLDSSEGLPDG